MGGWKAKQVRFARVSLATCQGPHGERQDSADKSGKVAWNRQWVAYKAKRLRFLPSYRLHPHPLRTESQMRCLPLYCRPRLNRHATRGGSGPCSAAAHPDLAHLFVCN